MTISEAARLVGKSVKTIRRWKNDGVNVFDESALREHSDFMDLRARGSAAKLAFDRPDAPTGTPKGVSFPGDSKQAMQALSIIEGLKTAFSKRLDESHRLLDIVLEGYFGA